MLPARGIGIPVDPEEVNWSGGVRLSVWQVWPPMKVNIDIGKVTILSSGTGKCMDINFPFFFLMIFDQTTC